MEQPIDIETDAEAADILCTNFSSTELRGLASNAGVSRERGDTMRQTAERIVAQDPALAARVIENDREVDMDATAFREAREVGEERISVEEAVRRAPNKKLRRRLERLQVELAGLPSYVAEVQWDYSGKALDGTGFRDNAGWNPGLISIVVERGEDWEGNGLGASRAHMVLKPTGRAMSLDISSITGSTDYADKHAGKPRRAWSMFFSLLERFYDPVMYDSKK